jgi:hypothetical protein
MVISSPSRTRTLGTVMPSLGSTAMSRDRTAARSTIDSVPKHFRTVAGAIVPDSACTH